MNADRFINAMVQVEEILRKAEGETSRDNLDLESLINRAKSISPEHKRKLHNWRKLRNVIVHTPRTNAQPIADPRGSEVIQLERMVEILRNPPRVSSVLSMRPPVVLSWDSEVSDFFSEMMPPKEFSQAPFLNLEGKYQLITSNAVARWTASNYEVTSGVILESIQISDVAKYSEEGDKLVCHRHDIAAQVAIDVLSSPKEITPVSILLTVAVHENGKAMGLVVKADLPALFKSVAP